ncbi:MAG: PH domain-containing protein [Verrucomicrobiales bacterium]
MEDSPDSLRYRCPLCDDVVSVAESLAGDKVECPACGRFFLAEIPRAAPLPNSTTGKASSPDVQRSADDEAIVEEIHPAVFRRHLLGFLLCLLLVAGGGAGIWFGLALLGSPEGLGILAGSGLAILIGLFFIVKWIIVSRTTKLTLTSERILYRHGIFNHRTSEVRYTDVRNIALDLSLRERLLGYGDLSVSSAGQDDMEIVIHDIPNPEKVVEKIRRSQ